jgi:Flp pilus assembly protein TadG
MRLRPSRVSPPAAAPASSSRRGRFRKDEGGAAALEFAGVVVPFLIFILGIMGSGLQFFAMNSLEHGVETAARQIRTGQAQTNGMTVAQFKTAVCGAAGSFIKCDDAHMSILVQNQASWGAIAAQNCKNGGSLAASTGTGTDLMKTHAGEDGRVVLITVCYKWDSTNGLYMYSPDKLSDGSVIMQASTAFRTECYATSCP